MVEGYVRYRSGEIYVVGDIVPEDPEGTVGTAVQSFTIDAAVVDGTGKAAYPRADFTWASLEVLCRWDVRKGGVMGLARPQCADTVRCRYLEGARRSSQIPCDIPCDRTFLAGARDGPYVKAVSTWLFEGEAAIQILKTDGIRNVVVDERSGREWKTALSIPWGPPVRYLSPTTGVFEAWMRRRRTFASGEGSSRGLRCLFRSTNFR